MVDIDSVLSKLSKHTRDKIQKASEIKLERLPTASIGIDDALNGGLVKGRITLVWGTKSAGKSVFAYQTIAKAQQLGQVCLLVDAEDSFDPEWAARLGIDSEKLLVSNVKSVDEMTDTIVEHIDAGVECVVVDSISALLPSSFYDKDNHELKDAQDTKQIGTFSKDLAGGLKMINATNKGRCNVIMISQMRNKIGMVTVPQPEGGEAMRFYSSVIIKLWSNASNVKQIKKNIKVGNQVIQKPVAREVNWTLEYSKTSEPNETGSYDMYYAGDFVGIDEISEVFNLAVDRGIVLKKGAWREYNGDSKYEKDWLDYFRENEEAKTLLIKEITEND